jgi:hypothetical protein
LSRVKRVRASPQGGVGRARIAQREQGQTVGHDRASAVVASIGAAF